MAFYLPEFVLIKSEKTDFYSDLGFSVSESFLGIFREIS